MFWGADSEPVENLVSKSMVSSLNEELAAVDDWATNPAVDFYPDLDSDRGKVRKSKLLHAFL